MNLWQAIAADISAALGRPFRPDKPRAVGGGCSNHCYVVEHGPLRLFVKLNPTECGSMFAAEFAGLRALRACAALRVPEPLCHGSYDGRAYLVMEHLELRRDGDARRAGEALAALHGIAGEQYGWWRDNRIGATLQRNERHRDWTAFWAERRLGPQLALAERNGYGGALLDGGRELQQRLSALLDGHRPPPSLLHGDLWNGNFAYHVSGAPAVFDPAVYHGDRETDLAMTELFGGFPGDFYTAYAGAWPLPDGYPVRRRLYNLYHVLNHLNLFGGGYRDQARALIDGLLAELR